MTKPFKATPINEDYNYGMLGEFKVIIHNKTNYMNITKLCSDGGREFRSWKRSNFDTLTFFDENYLKEDHVKSDYKCLYIIEPQHVKSLTKDIQEILLGTYCHMDVAIVVAVWISQEFKFKVSSIVRNYYHYSLFLEKEKLRIDNMSLTERLNSMEALIRSGQNDIKIDNLNLQSEVQASRLDIKVQTAKIDKLQEDVNKLYELCANKECSKEVIVIYREDGDDRSILRIRYGTADYIKNNTKNANIVATYKNISNSTMFLRKAKELGYVPKNGNSIVYTIPSGTDRKNLKIFLKAVDKKRVQERESS